MSERIYFFTVPGGHLEQEEYIENYCRYCAKDEGLKLADADDYSEQVCWSDCNGCGGDRCPGCGSHDYVADGGYPNEYAVCEKCGQRDLVT